jgi:hypothetical protein
VFNIEPARNCLFSLFSVGVFGDVGKRSGGDPKFGADSIGAENHYRALIEWSHAQHGGHVVGIRLELRIALLSTRGDTR